MTSPRDPAARGDDDAGIGGKADGRTSKAQAGKGGERAARGGGAADTVEIRLHHARNHHLRWVVAGAVFGGLCLTQLGTLGQMVGVLLLAMAAWAAFRVIQTLRHPPGTIVIAVDEVILPRGLCVGEPLHVNRSAITAGYLLRKSVAWHQAAPVLVVETGGKVLAYPRDWFAAEADQRRVLDALLDAPAAADPAA